MTIQRMEHVGIVVDDLAAATAFFVELAQVVTPRLLLAGAGEAITAHAGSTRLRP